MAAVIVIIGVIVVTIAVILSLCPFAVFFWQGDVSAHRQKM